MWGADKTFYGVHRRRDGLDLVAPGLGKIIAVESGT